MDHMKAAADEAVPEASHLHVHVQPLEPDEHASSIERPVREDVSGSPIDVSESGSFARHQCRHNERVRHVIVFENGELAEKQNIFLSPIREPASFQPLWTSAQEVDMAIGVQALERLPADAPVLVETIGFFGNYNSNNAIDEMYLRINWLVRRVSDSEKDGFLEHYDAFLEDRFPTVFSVVTRRGERNRVLGFVSHNDLPRALSELTYSSTYAPLLTARLCGCSSLGMLIIAVQIPKFKLDDESGRVF